jgi:hypothetical protein
VWKRALAIMCSLRVEDGNEPRTGHRLGTSDRLKWVDYTRYGNVVRDVLRPHLLTVYRDTPLLHGHRSARAAAAELALCPATRSRSNSHCISDSLILSLLRFRADNFASFPAQRF